MVSFLKTNNSVTLHYEGQTKVIAKDDSRFDKVLVAIREKRLGDIPSIVDTEAALRAQGLNAVDGLVYVGQEPMPTELNNRIMEYQAQDLPFDSLLKFWDNLKQNPSFNSRKQLFKFLENKGHSITEDGCFIGYRGVTEDFKDKHTKSFNNAPGQVCEIPRSAVDDNPDNTCSHGLHVGGYEYAKDFASGGKLVLVKVNPRDVVAVPNDYNGQKMRVCRFEVLKEATDIVPHLVVNSDGDEYDFEADEEGLFGEDLDDSADHIQDATRYIAGPQSEADKASMKLANDLLADLEEQGEEFPRMVGLSEQLSQFEAEQKKLRYANNHAKRDKTGRFAPKKKAAKRSARKGK